MVISEYKNGSKKFSHAMCIGNSEVIFYFSVSMSDGSINEFARILGIKNKVKKFYACVILTAACAPRTFMAYELAESGDIKEMFDISTGIDPIYIMRTGLVEGVLSNAGVK